MKEIIKCPSCKKKMVRRAINEKDIICINPECLFYGIWRRDVKD